MNNVLSSTQVIQAILAPAVMISASALFFLGLSARYIAIITRIRLLNDEKRHLAREFNRPSLAESEEIERFMNITHQIHVLMRLAWLVRISILCHICAVILFVLTSFTLGLDFFIDHETTKQIPLFIFIGGMIFVLGGVTSTGLDILKSYPVVLLEVQNVERYHQNHQNQNHPEK